MLEVKGVSQVYDFNGTQWVLSAQNIKTENPNYNVFLYITLRGSQIKLFDFFNGSHNYITIYTRVGSSFVQDSQQLTTQMIDAQLTSPGWSQSRNVSDDGTMILLQREHQHVVFKFNGTSWVKIGNVVSVLDWAPPIYIPAISMISQDGSTFMTVNFDMTVNEEPSAGMTKLYYYDASSNTWLKKGQDIVYEEITLIREANGLVYGSDAKCLSGDGSIILIGTRLRPNILYNENVHKGTVQAYRYSSVNNYWSKIGRVMTGTGRPGQYACINHAGNVIYLDDESYSNTTTSFNGGRIRAFEIEKLV